MTTLPDRLVLEGVPRINFFEGGTRCPEDLCLPSVLRALVEYLGDPDFGCEKCRARQPDAKIPCSYAFFAGITGAAFFLSWKEGWHMDNVAPVYLDKDPLAMEKSAFRALGYGFERVLPERGKDGRTRMARLVTESLQRGLPAVSYGVFGPPEPGLITGYDAGGDILIGWNFFQGTARETEPSGCYRKRDWQDSITSLLVLGEKTERPSLKVTFRSALQAALRIVRTPMVRADDTAPEGYRRRHNGLSAYTAWAAHVLRDEDFPAGHDPILRERHDIHNNCVGTLAEARWYGARFLIDMVDHVDGAVHRDAMEDVLQAAAMYAAEHALMWKAWDLTGGIGNPEAWRVFAEPAVRNRIAPLILQARQKDEQAAVHIENALEHMGAA